MPPPPTPRVALAEGTYRGVLSWPNGSYHFTSAGAVVDGSWHLTSGVVQLTVTGTAVSGGWNFSMEASGGGTSPAASGTATGEMLASGEFLGDATAPCMEGGVAIDGTVSISDASGTMELPIDDTFPIDCGRFTWTISTSGCSTASGEWTVPLSTAVGVSGASMPTNGTFELWRVADGVGTAEEDAAVDAQLVEMDRIVNTEPFDGPALAAVLRSIAEFEGNLARNVGCGQRSSDNMRIAGAFLFRLLVDRFLQDQPIELSTLRWMAYAALSTGQIGSAAAQPERAAYLAQNFIDRLNEMIVGAEAEGNEVRLANVESFARQYGWHDVETAASRAYDRLHPED